MTTDPGNITIADHNGPGIRPETVIDILDFGVRVSSREAYVLPTRGAQGNALNTILAMPFALDGGVGETRIEAPGIAHTIRFAVDHIRQEPKNRPHDSPVSGNKRHARDADLARFS